jgi:hypothetical protein
VSIIPPTVITDKKCYVLTVYNIVINSGSKTTGKNILEGITMKIKYTFLSMSALFLSLNANAETCGKLVSNQFVAQGDYSVVIEKHNDKQLNIPKANGLPLGSIEASGFVSLNLTPGLHSFRGYAVCAQSYCKRPSIYGGSEADQVNFVLNVEEGASYKVAAKPASPVNLLPGKRFEVFLVREESKVCEGSKPLDPLPDDTEIPKEQLVASL